jgi:CrcB protein
MGALGALGAVLRVVGVARIGALAGGALYVGTLAINVAGAFALGVLVGLRPDDDVLRLLGTGLLGSFTTWSALTLEVHRLFGAGRRWPAVALLVGSLALGLAALAAGRAVGGG